MQVLGIDIGGTGIKAAVVDTSAYVMLTERKRIPTPHSVTPGSVLAVIRELIDFYQWRGPVGMGFPGTFQGGKCLATNNLDSTWVGMDIETFFSQELDVSVRLANDADVAGYAEVYTSPDLKYMEKLLFLTLGTGVGSALFYKGVLLPGTEFGSLRYKSGILEDYISNRVRKSKDLSWSSFGKRLNRGLYYLYDILSPDQIIIGGGVSKKMHKYSEFIDLPIPVSAAQLQNTAGVIGAALYALPSK